MTHINFLKTVSLHNQKKSLWEFVKWSLKEKCFDLLSNSLNLFFMEMYRDQFGEFVCGYWGLKGFKGACNDGIVNKVYWSELNSSRILNLAYLYLVL